MSEFSQELLEKYEVLEKIGEGGMGRVYKVRHRVLQRFDVCKLIHSRVFLNDEQKKKFIREARISSQLKKHKNIVTVYGAGGESDTPFILFEYVKGVPLDKRIKEAKRVPVKEALFYAKEICEGLQQAHSSGIVHRDIKSENIILSDQIVEDFAIPKIADFGIAKGKGETNKHQKNDWAIHGTPSYMSPEQAAGEEATEQSDLYSVGIILYELLTGSVPFKGQSLHQVIMLHINAAPEPIHEVNPDIPIQVAELVHRAIEKRPADRYESAEDFAAKLDKALSFVDRWQKGNSGTLSGRQVPASLRRQPASGSFNTSTQKRGAPGAASASTMRFNVSTRGLRRANGTMGGVDELPPPAPTNKLKAIWDDWVARYPIQVVVGASILVLVVFAGILDLVLSLPGNKNSLQFSPRELRVSQGVAHAVVTWKSDAPYLSVVEFGLDEKQLQQEKGGNVEEADHTVKLSNLKAGGKYYYRIAYPSGEKSLPYSFTMLEPDFKFWSTALQDRGFRVEGDTSIPAKAVVFYLHGSTETRVASQEGDVYETTHAFKAEEMNQDAGDRISRVHLTFPTGEEIDIPGDKVKPR